jgi:hypothetical protein
LPVDFGTEHHQELFSGRETSSSLGAAAEHSGLVGANDMERMDSIDERATPGAAQLQQAIVSLRALIIDAPLKLQRRSLLGMGALTPIKQATPILRTFLDHPDLCPHRLAALIAWKTASRWDEVLRLSRSSCTILPETVTDPARILIDWDNRTKASRTNPHRASRWTIIEGPFTDEISAKLLPLEPTAPITLLSTAEIDRILLPHGYSAHSFKAGAMNHITRQLPPGQDSEVLLARLAKHQHPLDPTAVTLGCIRDHLALALTLGTKRATRLL